MESSSSTGSSKKAKGFDNIRHVVSCLVDGCYSDLSECREYHRRHKVCELHSKTPKVTIGGREQRFCQQCSRFHSLEEFDDGKRSCRKRLDGHNRRRRKPPSDFLSKSQQGTRLLPFSSTTSQSLPSTMVGSSWAGTREMEQNYSSGSSYYCHNDYAIGNLAHHHSLGEADYPTPEQLFPKPALGPNNGYDTTRVVDSDCALSLLSSATTAESRGIGIGHSIVPSMQYCEDPMSTTYNAHNNLHYQAHLFFPNGPHGSTSSDPDPVRHFKWQ